MPFVTSLMIRIRNYSFLLIGILTFTFDLLAQKTPPSIDGWRIHSSYAINNDLCEAGDKIYVASQNALFSYNKVLNEVDILSRATGLSDVTVVKTNYDILSGTLILVYDNANIDLIRNGKVTNIPEIMKQIIIGKKVINNITVFNQKAYLAGSFGVAVVDLLKQKIIDTYTNLGPGGTSLEISDIAFLNNTCYLATINGIYQAPLNSKNLSDFNSWSLMVSSTYSNTIKLFNNKLYAVIDSSLKVYNGTTWTNVPGLSPITIYSLRTSNNKLVMCDRSGLSIIDENESIQHLNFYTNKTGIISSDGKLYVIVDGLYLIQYDLATQTNNYIGPPGPQGSTSMKMAYSDKNIWIAGGTVFGYATSSGWNSPMYSSNKFYRFNTNEWTNYNNLNNPIINGAGDFVDVAINPETNHAFLANFGTGLIEMSSEGVIANYDTTNTSLRKFNSGFAGYNPLLVSGVAFDSDNNLWVSNYGAVNPLSVKTKDNLWYSFPVPSGVDNRLTHLVCDDYGSKWFINTRSQGILVFNDNYTPAFNGDDNYKVINDTKLNGYLPSNTVFCMAKDLSGTIWTGTLKGLCIFNNPENVFVPNADFDAQQIVIKTGLIYSNFLGDVPVYSIYVDAGNRKWIGTAQGVWLVSPDGYTVIQNFTTANSPLLSNTVYTIGIDESTGEVFFGTEKGICSYMGSASLASADQSKVFIYPNPVKPDYSGSIAIRGLLENAFVKITDVNGNLVYETKANGGMATWNGYTFTGKKAPTGIYIVFSTNTEGSNTWCGKIVLLN